MMSISWCLPWLKLALGEIDQFMVNEIRDEHWKVSL